MVNRKIAKTELKNNLQSVSSKCVSIENSIVMSQLMTKFTCTMFWEIDFKPLHWGKNAQI